MHHCCMDYITHIKRLQQRGWTQGQIAAAAGINRRTLTRSLRAGAIVKSSTIAALLTVSGKPPVKEINK